MISLARSQLSRAPGIITMSKTLPSMKRLVAQSIFTITPRCTKVDGSTTVYAPFPFTPRPIIGQNMLANLGSGR